MADWTTSFDSVAFRHRKSGCGVKQPPTETGRRGGGSCAQPPTVLPRRRARRVDAAASLLPACYRALANTFPNGRSRRVAATLTFDSFHVLVPAPLDGYLARTFFYHLPLRFKVLLHDLLS